MIRLIGADSGLTMATTRLAETILPKPILINCISIEKLTPYVVYKAKEDCILMLSRKNKSYNALHLAILSFLLSDAFFSYLLVKFT
jgi:hypothetical protein